MLELGAGVLIATGLWTRIGALAGIVAMIAAFAVGHFPKGLNPMVNGGELAVVYLGAFLAFLVYDSGKLSVDAFMRKK